MAKFLISVLAMTLTILIFSVHGQVNSPCSASMLTSVTPCMSFLSNSSYNGSSPTADCCNSIKSLASGGLNCLCLIGTANVPLNLPINRTLAISLPRACNMAGVPLQCKASAAPLSAPGPIALGPILSPEASLAPQASGVPPAEAPASDTTQTLSPPAATGSGAPTATTGNRLTPSVSSAAPTSSLSPALLLSALAFLFKHYQVLISSF